MYQKDTLLCEITDNTAVKKDPAIDFIYNKIKIGFPDSSVDEINGLQEFCCEHTYSCGRKSPTVSNKELDLTSSYIHGMYSIENIRSYLFRDDNMSMGRDNDLCVVEIEDTMTDGAYNPRRGYYLGGINTIAGMLYPNDVYNAGHSPKACLIRNLNYITSYLNEDDIISLQTISKNKDLSQGGGNTYITENASLKMDVPPGTIAQLNDKGVIVSYFSGILPLFKPFVLEFSAEMPENLLVLMEDVNNGSLRKYGVIRLNDNGLSVDCFVLDCGVTPGTKDTYRIRGLLSPNTNAQNFIR
jgi:hypothetical protein